MKPRLTAAAALSPAPHRVTNVVEPTSELGTLTVAAVGPRAPVTGLAIAGTGFTQR